MVNGSNTIKQNWLLVSQPLWAKDASSHASDPEPHSMNHTVSWTHLYCLDPAGRSQEDQGGVLFFRPGSILPDTSSLARPRILDGPEASNTPTPPCP